MGFHIRFYFTYLPRQKIICISVNRVILRTVSSLSLYPSTYNMLGIQGATNECLINEWKTGKRNKWNKANRMMWKEHVATGRELNFSCLYMWPLFSHSFFLKHLYWSIIALQWCVSFCFITNWISYTHTYIPISPPSCISLPPSLSHPSRWSQSTELISLCYAAASH